LVSVAFELSPIVVHHSGWDRTVPSATVALALSLFLFDLLMVWVVGVAAGAGAVVVSMTPIQALGFG